MNNIRNSAKAIIIEDDRILLTRNRNNAGEFYLLPGGGQRHGESLAEAVVRECMEEIGVRVSVGDLLLVRDYISANHEFAEQDDDVHQVEFMFRCQIAEGDVHVGKAPDDWQTGAEWVEMRRLNEVCLYPAAIVEPLQCIARGENPGTCYLGDVN
ncbi:NUDIX domain-containing protein [Candidatus Bipolaricaulota bacterium]|nr:NUDIX domain-containing protein [Candidatus Bipolaricaulota bacterium]